MSRYVFKLPDLGEGTVAAEIVSWLVNVGDTVSDGQAIAEMSTEKAVVELPAPVAGKVVARTGQPGDSIAVGAELIVIETAGAVGAKPGVAAAIPVAVAAKTALSATPVLHAADGGETTDRRVMASPATRRRAREAGIDLDRLVGSGPGGRIERVDVDRALSAPSSTNNLQVAAGAPTAAATNATEEIKVLGVRRVIAQRMSEAKRNIPHFTYVEEVDVTELEALRVHLNEAQGTAQPKLTLLPLIVAALTRTLKDFPQCNAHYDAARDVIVRHRAVHVGIATQTKDGLKVPVVRHAEALPLQSLAKQIREVSEAARNNRATRETLSGSTITVTSLGKLGGIVSTPVINAPEVAIMGINRMLARPVVFNGAIAIRQMMNLSSSFDHRFVDGFDAAAMIQALKLRLEHPATIFMPNT